MIIIQPVVLAVYQKKTYALCQLYRRQAVIQGNSNGKHAIRAVRKNIFRTGSGTKMLETMFGINEQ